MWDLRPIRPTDVDALMDMMIAMRSESPVLSKSVTVDRDRTSVMLHHMFVQKTLIGVIADGGCMLGIVGSNWYNDRIEAFEQMLYVKPEERGSFLGVRLIREFEKLARAIGAESVHVGSSTDISDERTARLYEKLGYSRSGISLSKEFNV